MTTKPPDQIFAGRINQEKLEELIVLHERFVQGVRGGKRLVLQFMNLSGLSFRKRNLTDGIFTGSAFIQSDLTGAIFDRANLFGCDLRYALLDGASLKKADLRGVCARGARLNGADMLQADLREGQILVSELSRELQALYVEVEAPNNHSTDLSNAKLSKKTLSDVKTAAADFRETEMQSVRLRNANARGANFEGANMENIDLSGADMTGVNLDNANMLGAVVEQTNFNGASLLGAIYDKHLKKLNNLDSSLDLLLQSHMRWVATAGREGEALDLSSYDMRSASALMHQARLTAVKANHTVFFGMNLGKIELQHCTMQEADFRNCALQGADFRGSDLTKAKFTKANLEKADFKPLLLNDVRKPVNLRDANFRYCDLRGANFQYADLTGADLSFALIDGADFRHALLESVKLDGNSFNDALISPPPLPPELTVETPVT